LWTWSARGLVGIAAIIGLIVIGQALSVWVAVAAGALVVLAIWSAGATAVVRVSGAAVAATLGLLSFNVVTDPFGRPPILLGLGFAVVVYAWTAYWYLRTHLSRPWSLGIGGTLAIAFVVALPFAFGDRGDAVESVPMRTPVESKLDVLLIVPAGAQQAAPPNAPPDRSVAADAYDVRYSVGVAQGTSVRWTLRQSADEGRARAAAAAAETRHTAGTAPLVPRDGADVLVLLVVDGTPPVITDPRALPQVAATPQEVGRWRRIAAAAAPAGTLTYAVLQTTDKRRLARWARIASPGGAVSAMDLESRTLTGAAGLLAVGAPTAHADYALAVKHRPILRFDGREEAPLPLSIESLFSDGRVQQCEDRRARGSACEVLTAPRDLINGGTHLELRVPSDSALQMKAFAAQDATDTAIYVHPVGVEAAGRRLLYLDYWWYLPSNPSNAGHGAFCGAGLVIPGISCFDHESDWEGITVVIDRTGDEPFPTAVHYAAHESVTRYVWQELRERWDDEAKFAPAMAGTTNPRDRPLVYVAEGTHASYPVPCSRRCVQTASGREEQPHRGDDSWQGNNEDRCTRVRCVRLIPTRAGGTQPALWNAFTGVWGKRHCVLRVYCDSTAPPAAPGNQGRYKHPTRFTGLVRGGDYKAMGFEE